MERVATYFIFAALCCVAFALPRHMSNLDVLRDRQNLAKDVAYPNNIYVIDYQNENFAEVYSPLYKDFADIPVDYLGEWVDIPTSEAVDDTDVVNIQESSDNLSFTASEADDTAEDNSQLASLGDASESSDGQESQVPLRRNRRQAEAAMNLALDHTDRSGNRRPVGRLHGSADLRVNGNNRHNYHGSGRAGVGSVLWRSRNNRHSVGVGATVDQYRGRFQGHRYQGRPRYGVGFGYRMRF